MRRRAIGPMSPMGPMPCAVRAHVLLKGVSRGAPSTCSLLARQNEARSARTRKPLDRHRKILPTPPLRVYDVLDLPIEIISRDRRRTVLGPPSCEKLDDTLAPGVLFLERFDALDRIAAAQTQQGIATPFSPCLKATKRLAAIKTRGVLAPKAPDRQYRGQYLGSPADDVFKETRCKRTRLGVFATGIELRINEPAGEVLRDAQAVPGNGDESSEFRATIRVWPSRRTLAGRSVSTDASVSERSAIPFALSRNTAGCASISSAARRLSNSCLSAPTVNARG